MKTRDELNAKLSELNDEELKVVTGGEATLHNVPRKKDDERYVLLMQANNKEYDTRKDHYENIILGG